MSTRKRLGLVVSEAWQPILYAALSFGAIIALLGYRLNTLVPGFSQLEVNSRIAASNWRAIVDNPTFLPYKILQYAALRFHHIGPLAMRSVSAIFGLLAIGLMYYLLRQWHSTRIAVMGTVLFATSSWFLGYARLATPAITFTLLLSALAYGTWVRRTRRSAIAIIIGAILMLYFIYTPGLIWFVILGIIWQWDTIKDQASKAPGTTFVAGFLLIALLVPLGYAIYRDATIAKLIIGLPPTTLPTISSVGKNILNTGNYLFVHGPSDPQTGLVRAPILDIFIIVMSAVGAYSYIFKRKLDRLKMLIGTLLLGLVLITLGGPVNLIFLAPFIYILASAGIAFLLLEWFSVFPRNPLARGVALGLIITAVAVTSFYQLNRYFIAWPQAPPTASAFNIKP